jgi:hypothetical protein
MSINHKKLNHSEIFINEWGLYEAVMDGAYITDFLQFSQLTRPLIVDMYNICIKRFLHREEYKPAAALSEQINFYFYGKPFESYAPKDRNLNVLEIQPQTSTQLIELGKELFFDSTFKIKTENHTPNDEVFNFITNTSNKKLLFGHFFGQLVPIRNWFLLYSKYDTPVNREYKLRGYTNDEDIFTDIVERLVNFVKLNYDQNELQFRDELGDMFN